MSGLRVLVTGSRTWTDRPTLRSALDTVGFASGFDGLTVVHGACPRGADAMADEWARHNRDLGVLVERHPANWHKYGKRAGFLRNQEMVRLGADLCLAFIRDNSAGATNTVDLAHAADIPTRVVAA